MYIISKDIKIAIIIKKCQLEGGVMAFHTGHACQTKMSRTIFLHCPSLSTMPFLPESSYKFWKLHYTMMVITNSAKTVDQPMQGVPEQSPNQVKRTMYSVRLGQVRLCQVWVRFGLGQVRFGLGLGQVWVRVRLGLVIA